MYLIKSHLAGYFRRNRKEARMLQGRILHFKEKRKKKRVVVYTVTHKENK